MFITIYHTIMMEFIKLCRGLICRVLCMFVVLVTLTLHISAQELNAKVSINKSQISNTKTSVFDALEKAIVEFLNDRQWTNMQYKENERINCMFNITLKTYSEAENSFTASLMVQSTRPVYNSNYTTTVFSIKDDHFDFLFQEFDQLNFQPEQLLDNLTAMLAYYAYLIIGLDMDTMAPLGGTAVLQEVYNLVNNAQNLGFPGWKAFEDSKNRFGIINDYMDGAMEPFRQMQYDYHRKGLDNMVDDVENGRAAITASLELLKTAYENKSLSQLPQIFTDYKRDEIVNIFSKQGSSSEREKVYDLVMRLNASQNTYWEKIMN